MITFFAYDINENKITVNEPEIFLVKEFADLWTNERNICEEDPTGTKKLRGFKEILYIYMAIDWRAPGSKDTPANRHKEALKASGLTEDDFDSNRVPKDPLLKAACQRYQELQLLSSSVGSLIETYQNEIHKIKTFVANIDYNERNDSGMPIFKVKDTLEQMQSLTKAMTAMEILQAKFKEEQEEASGLRGDHQIGMFDR